MFTSQNEIRNKIMNEEILPGGDFRNDPDRNIQRTVWHFLLLTILYMMFGAVYEHFSFGVHSFFMRYAFLPLLLLGAVPAQYLAMHPDVPVPAAAACRAWYAGIATLCTGSLFTGALEIYGTASVFSKIYLLIGILWLFAAVILHIKSRKC